MFKSFTEAAVMAGYAAAQTAVVTNYSVSTGTVQNVAKENVATTSLAMVYQELVNGANSYTVMNQTYNMNLAEGTTWSADSQAFAEIAVCSPSKNVAGTTVYDCSVIYVEDLTRTAGPQYQYNTLTNLA